MAPACIEVEWFPEPLESLLPAIAEFRNQAELCNLPLGGVRTYRVAFTITFAKDPVVETFDTDGCRFETDGCRFDTDGIGSRDNTGDGSERAFQDISSKPRTLPTKGSKGLSSTKSFGAKTCSLSIPCKSQSSLVSQSKFSSLKSSQSSLSILRPSFRSRSKALLGSSERRLVARHALRVISEKPLIETRFGNFLIKKRLASPLAVLAMFAASVLAILSPGSETVTVVEKDSHLVLLDRHSIATLVISTVMILLGVYVIAHKISRGLLSLTLRSFDAWFMFFNEVMQDGSHLYNTVYLSMQTGEASGIWIVTACVHKLSTIFAMLVFCHIDSVVVSRMSKVVAYIIMLLNLSFKYVENFSDDGWTSHEACWYNGCNSLPEIRRIALAHMMLFVSKALVANLLGREFAFLQSYYVECVDQEQANQRLDEYTSERSQDDSDSRATSGSPRTLKDLAKMQRTLSTVDQQRDPASPRLKDDMNAFDRSSIASSIPSAIASSLPSAACQKQTSISSAARQTEKLLTSPSNKLLASPSPVSWEKQIQSDAHPATLSLEPKAYPNCEWEDIIASSWDTTHSQHNRIQPLGFPAVHLSQVSLHRETGVIQPLGLPAVHLGHVSLAQETGAVQPLGLPAVHLGHVSLAQETGAVQSLALPLARGIGVVRI